MSKSKNAKYEPTYSNPFESNIEAGIAPIAKGLNTFFGFCKKMVGELDAVCSVASIAGDPVPKEFELTLKLFKISLAGLNKGEQNGIVEAASAALVEAQLVGIPVPKDAPAYMKLAEIAKEYVGPYMEGEPHKRTSTDMGLNAAGAVSTLVGLAPEKYGMKDLPMKYLSTTSGQALRHVAAIRSNKKMESRKVIHLNKTKKTKKKNGNNGNNEEL
jgi:hypothetical protein